MAAGPHRLSAAQLEAASMTLVPETAALPHLRPIRMHVPDHQLVAEAIEKGHEAERCNEKTLAGYARMLDHFVSFLHSRGQTIVSADADDTSDFMGHLKGRGGEQPAPSRRGCPWCRARNFPDGRTGPGWSAPYRKSHLAAVRFLYRYMCTRNDLPTCNPTQFLDAPKVPLAHQYTPTREEVARLMATSGPPQAVLVARWCFYTPSRRQTFADALWSHIDLVAGTWKVMGKGGEFDIWDLHPLVVAALREHYWNMERLAETNPAIRKALAYEDTAFVLLTKTGRKVQPQTITKMLKWHAIRAKVGVVPSSAKYDTVKGENGERVTSKVSPHAMRRAWADLALNDPDNPIPLDVIQETFKHKDISTTRRHYARTKPARARDALVSMRL